MCVCVCVCACCVCVFIVCSRWVIGKVQEETHILHGPILFKVLLEEPSSLHVHLVKRGISWLYVTTCIMYNWWWAAERSRPENKAADDISCTSTLPTTTRECRGGPRSQWWISCSESRAIMWVTAPTLATPTHVAVAFRSRKEQQTFRVWVYIFSFLMNVYASK